MTGDYGVETWEYGAMSRCVRSLALVCSLTLALPPGWWCLVETQSITTTNAA